LVDLRLTLTVTIRELQLTTLCKQNAYIFSKEMSLDISFFMCYNMFIGRDREI